MLILVDKHSETVSRPLTTSSYNWCWCCWHPFCMLMLRLCKQREFTCLSASELKWKVSKSSYALLYDNTTFDKSFVNLARSLQSKPFIIVKGSSVLVVTVVSIRVIYNWSFHLSVDVLNTTIKDLIYVENNVFTQINQHSTFWLVLPFYGEIRSVI